MKKNWLQKLLSWYKYMNNNTFTYTNILLNGIKEIKGEKIILKNKSLNDFANDYMWRTDAELSTLDATYPLDLSFKDFIQAYKSEIIKNSKNTARFSVFIDNEHIGNSMFYNIDYFNKSMELGIMIGKKNYWNKGHGTDTVNTMIEFIFNNTDFSKIYLHTLKWNTRAQQAFIKCGFTIIREIQKDNKNFVFMEIIKPNLR